MLWGMVERPGFVGASEADEAVLAARVNVVLDGVGCAVMKEERAVVAVVD